MNKKFEDALEYLYDIIETARFFSDVEEMTDFDITISPDGVDWGAYCSKPNNEGWFEEEDWMPQDGWPVYHLKTDSKEEIKSVVWDYLAEYEF